MKNPKMIKPLTAAQSACIDFDKSGLSIQEYVELLIDRAEKEIRSGDKEWGIELMRRAAYIVTYRAK